VAFLDLFLKIMDIFVSRRLCQLLGAGNEQGSLCSGTNPPPPAKSHYKFTGVNNRVNNYLSTFTFTGEMLKQCIHVVLKMVSDEIFQ